MKARTRRLVAGSLAAIYPVVVAWLGSFDFVRGFGLAYLFVICSVFAGLAGGFPFKDDE